MSSIGVSKFCWSSRTMAGTGTCLCKQRFHLWSHSSSALLTRITTRSFHIIFYLNATKNQMNWNKHNFPFILKADIRVLHEGGCTLHETYRALGRNAHVKACSSPRRMFEKNPICTSNNQTYENPFVTICLAGGFTHVREKIGGPCGNPIQRSCEKVTKIHESLKSASITERTKFLACGSDLRTYRSEHHLECSRPFNRCNTFDKQFFFCILFLFIHFPSHFIFLSDLALTHFGRCIDYNDICPEKLKYVQTAAPVCGTDGHSYITFDALLCARYRMNKSMYGQNKR